MESLKEVLSDKYGKSEYKLEQEYRKEYDNDILFKKLANSTKLDTNTLMKYTTKLRLSTKELSNCQNCKNILECQNEVSGYVYYPEAHDGLLEFSYAPCKYKKALDKENKYLDNIYYYSIADALKNAKMKDIDTHDKKRYPTIKWIKDFITTYDTNSKMKGLYLNGNFGCGKTYLLCAMLNELAKKGHKVAIIYYPEFLRSLKESLRDNEEYKKRFNDIKQVPLLLFDDIGAETVTEWARDEILGTILQYRMENFLPTFFTSNLTIEELEEHLSTTNKEVDVVKSRRIIERIKQLTDNITMISVNLRK